MNDFNELAEELGRKVDELKSEHPELFVERTEFCFYETIEMVYAILEEMAKGIQAASLKASEFMIRLSLNIPTFDILIDEEKARRLQLYNTLFPEWMDDIMGKTPLIYRAYDWFAGSVSMHLPAKHLPKLKR